jgi:sporulation protein YlmC with PRC-barrel domain
MICASILRAASAAALVVAFAAAQAATPVDASTLLGVRVASPQGERLGTVRDLAIDIRSGTVAYAIVNLHDPSALDSSLQAVPLEALRPGLARDQLVLERPATAGGRGGPSREAEARLMRASSVLGMDIDHPSGADYGVIRDLVVDLHTGRVLHASVGLDAAPDDAVRKVPFSALRFPPGEASAILTLASEYRR